jgi:hypothetical protein
VRASFATRLGRLTVTPAVEWQRWSRPVLTALAGGMLFILAWDVVFLVSNATDSMAAAGTDFYFYRDATKTWLATGQFYPAWQTTGPYVLALDHPGILYPPVVLILLVPFAFLPTPIAVLAWWGIPLAAIVVVVASWRPSLQAVVLILACLAWGGSISLVLFGNPMLWAVAAMALGTKLGWPYALILLKPSLAPLALLGVKHRSWWIVVAAAAIVSLAFGSLWVDWVHVMMNTTGPLANVAYSLHDVPLMLIPLIAYAGRPKLMGARTPNRRGA